MENATLDHAVEVVKALGPEEQLQIRAMIDSWQTPQPAKATPARATPARATPEQQRRLAERLLADGLLEHIPQDAYTEAARDRHEPVQVIGRPVSETLLEDRD